MLLSLRVIKYISLFQLLYILEDFPKGIGMLKASQVILWTTAASIRFALGSNICQDNNTIEEI